MAVAPTLITPTEVKELARIDRHVQPCDINDIRQVETTMARECLGKEFYADLVNDLNDYSSVAAWTNGVTYLVGQSVVYKGVYYTAIATTTAEPSLKSDWDLAEKFQSQCYNDLWCETLGRYLALLVVENSIPPISTPLTASGTVKKKGEGFDAANEASVLRLQNWVSSQVIAAFNNLHDYLTEDTNGCYGLYDGNQDTDCECKKQKYTYETAHWATNGGLYWQYDQNYCCDSISCDCPACLQKHKSKSNRYVIS